MYFEKKKMMEIVKKAENLIELVDNIRRQRKYHRRIVFSADARQRLKLTFYLFLSFW